MKPLYSFSRLGPRGQGVQAKTPARHLTKAKAVSCGLTFVLAAGWTTWPSQATTTPAGQENTLRVAIHYVVPPFVGGSKVRTPEAPDTELAQALADSLHVTLQTMPTSLLKLTHGATSAGPANNANSSGLAQPPAKPAGAESAAIIPAQAHLALVYLPDNSVAPDSTMAIATGYVSRPMAIMRSDTNIKSWEQLKGRSVCLSEGGRYAGTMAAQYGAMEKVFKAPADSLLALRTGGCDAAVHDDFMLKELLKLPEWKKFSATLPPRANTAASLSFVVPAGQTETIGAVKDLLKQWRKHDYLKTMNKKRVDDIAFEVYLDQVIPDCH